MPWAPPVTTATRPCEVDLVHQESPFSAAAPAGVSRQSAMYWRMIVGEVLVGVQAEAGGALGGAAARPVATIPAMRLVAHEAHPLAHRLAGDLLERVEHLADGDVDRGQVEREPAAELLDGSPRRRRSGRRPCAPASVSGCETVAGDRADRLLAGERLADDAGEERGGGAVRPAGPHGHRHQPRRAAVDEALARVVGDQVLADQLVRAVGGLRRGQGVVGDEVGQGRDGSGPNTATELENTSRAGCRRRTVAARRASSRARVVSRLERRPRSKSASHSPRHRRGEVEDAVEALLARAPRTGRAAGRCGPRRARRSQLGRRRDLVGEDQPLDRPAGERAARRAGRGRGARRRSRRRR